MCAELYPHTVPTSFPISGAQAHNMVGSNNNWKMVVLLQWLVVSCYFTEVNRKFLCSGHSFLLCQRAFAQVEKTSGRKSLELHALINYVAWLQSNLKKDPVLKIMEAMWICLCADNPTVLHVRAGHNVLHP